MIEINKSQLKIHMEGVDLQ